MLMLALLPVQLVFAQTTGDDLVNLAVIGEINVTLNQICQDSIIPEEVLTGSFDADGNGISYPLSDFSVIVEDGNEDNGPVIDGCGTYSFRVEAAPNVMGFTTGWGVVNAEDKTAPVFTSTPSAPAGPLYCDAIDDIDITVLPNTVSRCYRVNTLSGNIVPGSLNGQLNARLLAGGGLPTATDNCSPEVEICVNDIVTRDPVNPDCNPVTIVRSFTVTDGGCPSVSGEDNDPGTTSYEIVFTRPTLADIDTTNIPQTVEISCDELDGLGLAFGDLPAPRDQDLPFITGPDGTNITIGLGDDNRFCNIGLFFEDSPILNTCALGYKAVRTYTVIDWCNPGEFETLTQIIKIGDFEAPTFTAPTQDADFDGVPDDGPLQFVTNAGNQCGAYIRLDLAGIALTDGCSTELTLSATIYPNGNFNATPLGAYPLDLEDGNAELSDLVPAGDHIIRYTYGDDCGNQDFTDVSISVADGSAPIASCEDGLNISLTAGVTGDGQSSLGLAVITPGMVDNLSTDDCGSVSLAVGRVQQNNDGTYGLLPGASYGPRVDLTCEDLGTALVGLEVSDQNGNLNYCWMTVLVEDKTAPVCIPPSPVNLTCAQFDALGLPDDVTTATDAQVTAAFGAANAQDNCAATITATISGDVNTCGSGSLTRTFQLSDPSGNTTTCSQQITIREFHDYTISFPGDEEVFCMEAPQLADVTTSEFGCDLLIKDVAIDTFQSQVDECYLLRISHTVINFCEYNTLGDPYLIRRDADGDGNLNERVYVHLLPGNPAILSDDSAILDNDANRNNGNAIPFAFIPVDDGDDNDGSDDNNGNDSEDSQAANGVGFPYGTDDSRGAFLYYQFISVYDEVAPVIDATAPVECFAAQGANCTGSVQLSFSATDACTAADQLDVRVELDEDFTATTGFTRDRFLLDAEVNRDGDGNVTVSLNNVPVGNHAIRIRVGDGCGNFDAQVVEFCVTDDLAPTPICISMLTVTLMPNGDGTGNAAVWANDFIASDVEDCSGEVTYSIYTEQEAGAAGFAPAPGQTGIILDCTSDQTVPVRVYAFDPAGRSDYCSVFVLVQQADNACATSNLGNIGGVIISEYGGTFANVAVTLDGPDNQLMNVSGLDGSFLFQNLPFDDDYTLTAGLDSYILHSQGVSTFDLVLITQHILGQVPLTSPYQLLAADVNNDREVTVQDLIAIRRLILGYDDAFPNSEAYRFVDENFIFPLNDNPWATSFPEAVNINNLGLNVFDADFIGIMIGDVNGDGLDNLTGGTSQPRSGNKALLTDDRLVQAGQTYAVTIRAGAASELKGLQGTFSVNGARVTDVDYGRLTAGDINPRLAERGLVSFSYSEGNLSAGDELLTLHLTAERDGRLSELFTVSDQLITAEGYTRNNVRVNLSVAFTALDDEAGALTATHYPNPLREATTLSFNAPVAGATTLTVSDLNGKTVLTQQFDAVAGANTVRLYRRDFGASGLYTYRLQQGDEVVTRKVVVD